MPRPTSVGLTPRLARALRLLVLALLGAPALAAAPPTVGTAPHLPHYSEVVWYEVFVRSFQDSDGDGVGDLRGVTSRLPYLAELGIGGIWLMPIHPSPSYHGYDVSDYMGVNPEYGTLADLRELLARAHELGMRVIIDFVPNHSSDEHPWFRSSLAGDPEYVDYYVWHDGQAAPPPWRGTRGGSAWHEAPTGGAHYLGLFSPRMPDLDHRNPEVVAEMKEVARFWLGQGVDGFRVDAIQHIIESEEGRISNTEETYAWVADLAAFMREEAPHAFLVGETWTELPAILRYHEAGLHMSFDYPLWRTLLAAIQARSAADLGDHLAQNERHYPAGAARGTFLSNHDQTRPATLLSFLRRDEARMKLAAGLLLTLPGTPFLYYGEEIGMPDGPGSFDVEKRTPMRWEEADDEGRFGFSTAAPWTDPGEPLPGVSVAAQRADERSVWHAYRRLIELRNASPALNRGDLTLLDGGDRALLAVARSADGQRRVVLANLSTREVEVELAALGLSSEDVAGELQPLLPASGEGTDPALGEGGVAVPPLGLVILELR